MSCKVENLEKNMAKLTIEVSAAEFEKACEKAYQKNKNSINVQGFRKGKAPRSVIERMYGKEVMFEDAFNIVAQPAYEAAIDENKLEPVSQPVVDIVNR